MSRLCYCGHPKADHVEPLSLPGRPTSSSCEHVDKHGEPCRGCEGYRSAARKGDRLTFGVDRMPRSQAVTAPAWTLPEEETP